MAAKKGEPARYLNEVVLPYTGDDCLTWPFCRDPNGRARMRFEGKCAHVCRMVCEAVNGAPPSPIHQAAHSCGKGHLGCVTPAHQIWKTPEENSHDRRAHGTVSRTLNEDDVRSIRAVLAHGWPNVANLARDYGCGEAAIRDVLLGKTWAWVGMPIPVTKIRSMSRNCRKGVRRAATDHAYRLAAALRELASLGIWQTKAARMVKTSGPRVGKMAEKFGISFPRKTNNDTAFCRAVRNGYEQGLMPGSIAESTGSSVVSVKVTASRLGLTSWAPDRRKHHHVSVAHKNSEG